MPTVEPSNSSKPAPPAAPSTSTRRLTLARLRHSAGRVLEDMGQTDQAFHEYDRALNERLALAQSRPTDRRVLRDLGTSHNDIGNWFKATDQPEKALSSFQAARDIRSGLADSDRSDREGPGRAGRDPGQHRRSPLRHGAPGRGNRGL